jgi:hypothetical protein
MAGCQGRVSQLGDAGGLRVKMHFFNVLLLANQWGISFYPELYGFSAVVG